MYNLLAFTENVLLHANENQIQVHTKQSICSEKQSEREIFSKFFCFPAAYMVKFRGQCKIVF